MNPALKLLARFELSAFEKAYVRPSHSLISDMVRARQACLLQALHDVPPDSAILEVGCNFGGLLRAVLDAGYANVTACDVDIQGLEKARIYAPEARLALCSAEDLAYGDRSQDVVICAGVLNYLGNPEKSLAEIRRVLHPDGLCILTVGNARSSGRAIVSWGRLMRMQRPGQRGYRYFTRRQVAGVLRPTGFELQEIRYCLHALPFEYRWLPASKMGQRIARLRRVLLQALGPWWGNEFLMMARPDR